MCLIKTFLLLAILVGFAEQTTLRVSATVNCLFNVPQWCYELKYYESDKAKSDVLKTIDWRCSSHSSQNQKFDVTVDADEDPNIELYAQVRHNCTTDGSEKTKGKIVSEGLPYDSSSVFDVTDTYRLDKDYQ